MSFDKPRALTSSGYIKRRDVARLSVPAGLVTTILIVVWIYRSPYAQIRETHADANASPSALVADDGISSESDDRVSLERTKSSENHSHLLVHVMSGHSRTPCVGFSVDFFGADTGGDDLKHDRRLTLEGWSRVLVDIDDRVVGVPVPRDALRDTTDRPMRPSSAPVRSTVTNDDGNAVIGLDTTDGSIASVRVSGLGTSIRARVPTGSRRVDIQFPTDHLHEYRLQGVLGSHREPPPLCLVHRSNSSIIRLRSIDGINYNGPPPPQWAPFFPENCGYALVEPVKLDEGRSITDLEFYRLEELRVIDGMTGKPVEQLSVTDLHPLSWHVTNAQNLVSRHGVFFPRRRNQSVRLVQSNGYKSRFLTKETNLIRLEHGEDPDFEVHSESDVSFDFDLIPLPPGGLSPISLTTKAFDAKHHAGGFSRHRAPIGRYLVAPRSDLLSSAIVDVRSRTASIVHIDAPDHMIVTHEAGLNLVAFDRAGRCLQPSIRDETESQFTGLANGPVRVADTFDPKSENVFLLENERREFEFEPCRRENPGAQLVFMTPGWVIDGKPHSVEVVELSDALASTIFRHDSGAYGNCTWASGRKPVHLPSAFQGLRFNLTHDGDPPTVNATFLRDNLALRLEVVRTGNNYSLSVPSVGRGALLLQWSGGGQYCTAPFPPSIGRVPSQSEARQWRTEPLVVSPRDGGLHVVITDDRNRIIDSFFTRELTSWQARVPVDRFRNWKVVAMSAGTHRVEDLRRVLIRGLIDG